MLKIPRIPHWRWLTFHVLKEWPHPDLDEEIILFGRELTGRYQDSERHPYEIVGLTSLLDHEEELNEDIAQAIELNKRAPFRKMLERMLLERCEIDHIREALFFKFGITTTDEAVDHYRMLFWDNELLNAYDFAKHYEKTGPSNRPKPPPANGKWRSRYVAFKEGADIDLDLDEAMKEIFIHSFFRAKELSKLGMKGDSNVLKYHKSALSAYRAIKEQSRPGARGTIEMPDSFKVELYHPDRVAMEPGALDGYDPVTDSGYDKEEPEEDE